MVVKRPNVPSTLSKNTRSMAQIKATGKALDRVVSRIPLQDIENLFLQRCQQDNLPVDDEFVKKEAKVIAYSLARICVNQGTEEDINMVMADHGLSHDDVKSFFPAIEGDIQNEPTLLDTRR